MGVLGNTSIVKILFETLKKKKKKVINARNQGPKVTSLEKKYRGLKVETCWGVFLVEIFL